MKLTIIRPDTLRCPDNFHVFKCHGLHEVEHAVSLALDLMDKVGVNKVVFACSHRSNVHDS